MYRFQCFGRFQLDEHSTFHEKIRYVISHHHAIVVDLDCFLLIDSHPSLSKLVRKSVLIRFLEEPPARLKQRTRSI